MLFRSQFDDGFANHIKSLTNKIFCSDLTNETWVISGGDDQKLLSRLNSSFISLSENTGGHAFRGILTGLTDAFIINSETKARLINEDNRSKELIKPFLMGRNIKPYATPEASNWLILIPKGFTIKRNLPETNPYHVSEPPPHYGELPYDEAWNWFKKNYPPIAAHLMPFKEKAELRTDQGDFWWELRACDYYHTFFTEKIMYQVFQVKPCFIFDEVGSFCNNSMWIIPKGDKILLAILNSKMGWWLISKYCTAIQNGYQLIWKYFGQIPIPQYNENESESISNLVNQILIAKKNSGSTNTITLEKAIDQLVYELYGLTEEEIKIVEGTI